ncbi:hypothetical protein NP493_1162g01003 [Ridgeia piscesae]|uniref:Uncharacterized protein n=1 Tax=Ridgeia piscesae TaxID=27915 RepID=A0AAD9NGZ1_RIDPI|nr:hypothetical protein NP493_1162g01003 [Ridgeia piscesae]
MHAYANTHSPHLQTHSVHRCTSTQHVWVCIHLQTRAHTTRHRHNPVVVAACPGNCDHCVTDPDGSNGKCLDQQCAAKYAIKTDRFCYLFVFSACSAHCVECAFASDGSSTCSKCDTSYYLTNGICEAVTLRELTSVTRANVTLVTYSTPQRTPVELALLTVLTAPQVERESVILRNVMLDLRTKLRQTNVKNSTLRCAKCVVACASGCADCDINGPGKCNSDGCSDRFGYNSGTTKCVG